MWADLLSGTGAITSLPNVVILLTGGCGFIGSNLVRVILRDGGQMGQPLRVINLDALTYAGNRASLADIENDPRYLFVHGDIRDSRLVKSILHEHSVDAVLNLAAESHVDRSIDSPEPFFDANVIGTLRILEASRRYWLELPSERKQNFRFLHVSTDEVYGSLQPEDAAFSEETPYAPNSPYAASKAASDHAVRAYGHTYGLPTLTTNCSNNYGPYQFPEKLIPLVILNALDGKPLPIYGDGMNVRDWLYVEDHCDGILSVLRCGRVMDTYNIGGLNEQTNLEVVGTICASLDRLRPRADGASYRSQITFVPDRPGHDRRYAIDCSKIQKELGWAPKESFATGMERTARWYLDNRPWWRELQERYQQQRLGLSPAARPA